MSAENFDLICDQNISFIVIEVNSNFILFIVKN